jgi:hypothetical protein
MCAVGTCAKRRSEMRLDARAGGNREKAILSVSDKDLGTLGDTEGGRTKPSAEVRVSTSFFRLIHPPSTHILGGMRPAPPKTRNPPKTNAHKCRWGGDLPRLNRQKLGISAGETKKPSPVVSLLRISLSGQNLRGQCTSGRFTATSGATSVVFFNRVDQAT